MTPKLNPITEQAEVPAPTVLPPLDLFVQMGRQQCEFFTTAQWPTLPDQQLPIAYIVRRDGLYERRINDVGVFMIRREKFENPLPGFPKEDSLEGFMLEHGQIPYELLQEIIYFFKAICDDSKDEVYMQIFYSLEDQIVDGKHIPAGVHFNHCPTQVVSGASVEFARNVELESKNVLVLEIHSHNTMGAYFSSVDNKDEKSDRLFGVVGKLDGYKPDMLFSFVCGGKRVNVKQDDIFTKPLEELNPFPKEWRGNVSKGGTATNSGPNFSHYETGKGWQTQQTPQKTDPVSPGPTRWGNSESWADYYKNDDKDQRSASVSGSGPNKSEIKAEVVRAIAIGLGSQPQMETVLKSQDFMKDTSNGKVVSLEASEVVPVSLPSTIVRPAAVKLEQVGSEVPTLRPFFRRNADDDQTSDAIDEQIMVWRNQQEIEAWDQELGHKLQEIQTQFLNQKFLDEEMTDDNKKALFQDLMAYLEEADVNLLAETMVDMGHGELLTNALQGTEVVDFDDTDTTLVPNGV